MQVNVRLFAGLFQAVGQREVVLDVDEGADVTALRLRFADVYPVAKPFLETLVIAVDEEYVPGEYVLSEGERVAMIPPVSGGSTASSQHPARAFSPRVRSCEARDV
jgi:molybdopterin synthase catalytic subunit